MRSTVLLLLSLSALVSMSTAAPAATGRQSAPLDLFLQLMTAADKKDCYRYPCPLGQCCLSGACVAGGCCGSSCNVDADCVGPAQNYCTKCVNARCGRDDSYVPKATVVFMYKEEY
jgi:hypothetical protein